MKANQVKTGLLIGSVGLTLAIHYGWILEPIFGQAHWIHAVHGRFCYIPIVIAATWFGLRGSLYTALAISIMVLPFVFSSDFGTHNLTGELVEIIFYFAIAILAGGLTDRELQARRKQEQAQLGLERAHRLSAIGQMAASVAHEIKNPLASIKGAVEIIGDKSSSESDKAEFQTIVADEIKRIDGTIIEFLAFARPKPTRLERLDLSSLLIHSLRQIAQQTDRAGIKVKHKIEPSLLVNGDREKLHQVILNLMLNAIQASERDSTIHVTLSSEPSEIVRLSIRDHGPGMTMEEVGKVLDPFYTTKPSGSGLGLTVVNAIIEEHNGRILINSKPGEGTEVAAELPAYREE